MWTKGKIIDDAVEIGVEERGLYKLKGHTDSSLTTSTINPSDLWHRILAHVDQKSIPIVSKVVTDLPKVQIKHEGVCKGCAQGKNTKNPFLKSNSKEKGILDIIQSDTCGSMQTTSLSGYSYYASFIMMTTPERLGYTS